MGDPSESQVAQLNDILTNEDANETVITEWIDFCEDAE